MSTLKNFLEIAKIIQQEFAQVSSVIEIDEVQRFVQQLLEAKRMFIAGKGRTGLQRCFFAIRLIHLGLPVHGIGDETTPAIGSGDLLVIGTASGKTPSLVAYADIIAQIGATIISITLNTENPISEQSVVDIIIPGPSHKNDAGVDTLPPIMPLGGLLEMALGLLLNILVLQLVDHFEVNEADMVIRHANLD
jgi:6-phospho-3-hexuloisomerase